MLKEFTDIAPKAALVAALLWAGTNYLVIAPEVGARIARADHLPACRANIEQVAVQQSRQAIAALPKPLVSQAQEAAASRIRSLQGGMMGQMLNDPMLEQVFGFGAMTNAALAEYEQGKRAAAEAYASTVEQIQSATAAHIDGADDLCGCLANAALNEARNDWTIFTATLGLIKPAPVQNFSQRIMQQDAGVCGQAGA